MKKEFAAGSWFTVNDPKSLDLHNVLCVKKGTTLVGIAVEQHEDFAPTDWKVFFFTEKGEYLNSYLVNKGQVQVIEPPKWAEGIKVAKVPYFEEEPDITTGLVDQRNNMIYNDCSKIKLDKTVQLFNSITQHLSAISAPK